MGACLSILNLIKKLSPKWGGGQYYIVGPLLRGYVYVLYMYMYMYITNHMEDFACIHRISYN